MTIQNPEGHWYHQGTYRIVIIADKESKVIPLIEGKQAFFEEGTTICVPDGMFQRSKDNFNFYDGRDPVHHFVIPDDCIETISAEDGRILWIGPERQWHYSNNF